MRIKWRTQTVKNHIRIRWHKWFAWFPVRIDSHDYVWFQMVERKGTWVNAHTYGFHKGYYEYDFRFKIK